MYVKNYIFLFCELFYRLSHGSPLGAKKFILAGMQPRYQAPKPYYH